jgi:hypothetical protein
MGDVKEYKQTELKLLDLRKIVFDLVVERRPFISSMETLEEAISSFLHVCFVANMEYPTGSGILATYLQRMVAKLDQNGLKAAETRKDLANKEDKKGRAFQKAFDALARSSFMLSHCTSTPRDH